MILEEKGCCCHDAWQPMALQEAFRTTVQYGGVAPRCMQRGLPFRLLSCNLGVSAGLSATWLGGLPGPSLVDEFSSRDQRIGCFHLPSCGRSPVPWSFRECDHSRSEHPSWMLFGHKRPSILCEGLLISSAPP